MTLRRSDLQSDSDLDSIHNSCDVFNDEPPSSYGNLLFTGNSKIGPQSDRGEEGARGVMPKKTGHFL